MKTNYFLLIVGFLLISCNKTETEKKSKTLATKKEIVNPENVFTNKQIWNLEYQIGAFKIGSEKTANPELKKYLKENLPKLEQLLKDYKAAANNEKIDVKAVSSDYQNELYKLAIADTKGFDNVFKLYYKEFLAKTIQEISADTLEDKTFDSLKNRYGNLLYEQKLYFDIL